MKFLEQINKQANGELAEGAWDVAKDIYRAGKAAVAAKNASPPSLPPSLPPSSPPPNPHASADTSIPHVVDGLEDFTESVQNVMVGGHYRTIVFCKRSWFMSVFMKSNDGTAAIKTLDDTTFTALFTKFKSDFPSLGSADKEITEPNAGFTLRIMKGEELSLNSQVKAGNGDIAIFLEIPKSQFAKLNTAATIEDQRKSFGHLFNYHFYMFAVYRDCAERLKPYEGFDSNTNGPDSTKMQAIDPHILLAHAGSGMFGKLKNEWDEVWSPEARLAKNQASTSDTNNAAKDAEKADAEKSASVDKAKVNQLDAAAELKAKQSPSGPTGMADLEKSVYQILIKYPESKDAAAKQLLMDKLNSIAPGKGPGDSEWDKAHAEIKKIVGSTSRSELNRTL